MVSNFIGPDLTDILASLAAIVGLVVLMKFWQPKDAVACTPHRHTAGNVFLAWTPYAWLVVFVLLWGNGSVKTILNRATVVFTWPGLHNMVQRMPPITPQPSPYAASYTFNWLSASGTSCLFAVIVSAIVLRVSPAKLATGPG